MNNLDMEKFSPKKAELQKLADEYKSLTIKGVDDVDGYSKVVEALKVLQKKRKGLKDTGKELRQDARDFASAVIELENSLVGILQPTEEKLKEMRKSIDNERLIVERKALLPDRKEKLEKINVEVSDDELLLMSPEKFQEFYNLKNAEYLEEKERKLAEAEMEVKRKADIENAKKEARLKAEKEAKEEAKRKEKEVKEEAKRKEREAEEAKKKAVEEAEAKKEAEKQKIIDAQKEKDRVSNEIKEREERQAKIKADEQAKLEKEKKYIKFLADNGCTPKTKDEFYVLAKGEDRILYKKIAIYNQK